MDEGFHLAEFEEYIDKQDKRYEDRGELESIINSSGGREVCHSP